MVFSLKQSDSVEGLTSERMDQILFLMDLDLMYDLFDEIKTTFAFIDGCIAVGETDE